MAPDLCASVPSVPRTSRVWRNVPEQPYPRIGERLAPVLLGPVLDVPVARVCRVEGAGADLRLADLDESTWDKFPPQACRELARAVVRQVQRCWYALSRGEWNRHFPRPRRAIPVDRLALEKRTRTALHRYRTYRLKLPDEWAGMTVLTFLQMRGFGAKSLVDLCCAFETECARVGIQPGREPPPAARTGRIEEALLRDWAVDPSATSVPRRLLDYPLPAPPAGLTLELIELPTKTLDRLRRRLPTHGLESLPQLTVRDLLAVPRFGAESLRTLIDALARPTAWPALPVAASLEEEMRQVFSALLPRASARNVAIALAYLGLDGGGGGSIRDIGSRFGMTGESVRLITNAFVRAVPRRRPNTPVLARALEAAGRDLPRPAEEVEVALVGLGLTRAGFPLRHLARAARLFGLPAAWRLEQIGRAPVVVRADDPGLARRIVAIARSEVQRSGALTVADLAGRIASRTGGKAVGRSNLASLLPRVPGFSWLGGKGEWFWFTDSGLNRLRYGVRKAMSVFRRIGVAELREGLRHDRRLGDVFALPAPILLECCRQTPGVRVEGREVIARPALDWRDVLTGSERVLVGIFRRHGPAVTIERIRARARAAGVHQPSVSGFLFGSGLVDRLAPGVYALHGDKVSARRVRELLDGRPRPIGRPPRKW